MNWNARVRLMVLDVSLALGSRESELKKAKAKLRPLIGMHCDRCRLRSGWFASGRSDTVPPPELNDAITLAEARRPDMMSDRHAIAQASANVHSEQRKAKPQVSLTPGWSYQYQRAATGFRNGSMLDVGVSTTLPITDRNQGNIRKAEWQLTEAQLAHQANVADLRAEVESVLNDYIDAVEDVRKTDDPVTRRTPAN